MVKIINTVFIVIWLVTSSTSHTVDGMHSVFKEDFERQHNLINRSHVKSIQTKSGYIVDCVDINNQPAFDHPLLKNHKLQRKPSFEKKLNETSVMISPTKTIHWLEKVRCPKGTVPIRRITKDDLIRGKSLFNNHSLTQNSSIRHVSYVSIKTLRTYYGVRGITSIYNPKVYKGQSSASYLYVQSGQEDEKIMIGWHVSPELYNDDDSTYFYSLWTSDNFKSTGCYNMLCNGFVQTDTSYYLGSRIAKTSTYGDEMIEMSISLNQDPKSHNWWLNVENKNIGYFPAAIFSNMVTNTNLGWGGLTVTHVGASSPPMGSGHFPDENFVHACYFRYVGYQVDDSGKYYGPDRDDTQEVVYAPKCYDVNYYGDQGEEFGYSLQFGGPGGGDCATESAVTSTTGQTSTTTEMIFHNGYY